MRLIVLIIILMNSNVSLGTSAEEIRVPFNKESAQILGFYGDLLVTEQWVVSQMGKPFLMNLMKIKFSQDLQAM